jgi:hypothetical protein
MCNVTVEIAYSPNKDRSFSVPCFVANIREKRFLIFYEKQEFT